MTKTTRRQTLQILSAGAFAGLAPGLLSTTVLAATPIRIAMVVKALGIGFFDACRDGGQEAAKELGDCELIYTARPRQPLKNRLR